MNQSNEFPFRIGTNFF